MTYDVRIYAIEVRRDRPKPHRVRWRVGKRDHSKSFRLKPQADGRRSELMSAVRRGEQFDTETGLPVSELRAQRGSVTWYEHTRSFVDRTWDRIPAKSRRNVADALATITPALVKAEAGGPDPRVLRRALYSWAYNKNRWQEEPPAQWAKALTWVEKHSLSMAELEDPPTLRRALEALGERLDGKPAAARTVKRKRACLSDVLGLAVEEKLLPSGINPLTSLRWATPRTAEQVDPESVANPHQVRQLLAGVRAQGSRGEHLEAFFGCLYYAAMRPAEAIRLTKRQCFLPKRGWGRLVLRGGVVRAGRGWTDDGQAHEVRGLKARAPEDSRPVPVPPSFVRMLRWHIERFGTTDDGRLFRTSRGGLLQESGYGEVWARARREVLSEQEVASLLARRPYDLRLAGISFWLSSGVDPAECARRAGHSLAVLFRVYAKILAHNEDRANRRIEAAIREWDAAGT
ncbi:tyrosine-type recombinase/integrase [Streptomyces sp. 4N509B]|uniref:tyrosine-type recombinase/integrase n=1 Tax=Streptomyces sp. 4N509B TaxID=3457413 RepID=UPI003FD488FE